MNWLLEQKNQLQISAEAYTFSLMYLLKTNDLAKEFESSGGFEIFSKLLDDKCQTSYQVAYNVIASLWVVSYHPFAIKNFEDYNFNIIEKAVKVLDFFNKEKIVRVVLLLLDNLKQASEACHEIMSDINLFGTVIKL